MRRHHIIYGAVVLAISFLVMTATVLSAKRTRAQITNQGLLGQYYNTQSFGRLKLTRVDPAINFNWGTGAPASGMGSNSFSIRWTGYVLPQYSQTYKFYAKVNDGVRLWVNNVQVINKWSNQNGNEVSGQITLQAGVYYPIRVEYYEDSGSALIALSWSSAARSKEVIPSSALFVAKPTATPTPTSTPIPSPTNVPTPTTVASSPTTQPSNCSVSVSPGTDIQSVINSQPEGATICLGTGVFRGQTINPKNGQKIIGSTGTKLNGAKVLTGWVPSGTHWSIGGQTQELPSGGECDSGLDCNHGEELFINDSIQAHVKSLAEVAPGKWYFDYAGDTVYIGEDPAGKTIEMSNTQFAVASNSNNVTLQNFTVEKYGSPAQFGAINIGEDNNKPTGWLLDGVSANLNHGSGIVFRTNNSVFKNGRTAYNAQQGIGGSGLNNQVVNMEIDHNNFRRSFSIGWSAGGSKFALTDGLLVKDSYAHDNQGPGLWTDVDNINTTYDHNLVENNTEDGIFHEISYKATIKNNTVVGNGYGRTDWCYGSGILISASSDVEVFNNVVKNNRRSINAIQQQRGTGAYGPHESRNFNIHDNYTEGGTSGSSETAACEDYNAGITTAAWNNHFQGNKYYGTHVNWGWANHGIFDFSEWQGYGLDTTGQYLPNDTIPANLFITR